MHLLCVFWFGMAPGWFGVIDAEAQSSLQPFVNVAPTAGVDVADNDRYTGYVVGWGDYDRDGWLDLYTGIGGADGWSGQPGPGYPPQKARLRYNRLYDNEGNGTFRDVTVRAGMLNPANVTDIAWGDYDNDGWTDCYLSNADTSGLLFHNEGNGTFREVTLIAGVYDAVQGGIGAAWADYDRDSWLDLYVVKVTVGYVAGVGRLYRNRGDGTFEEVASKAGVARPGLMVAWGDYDQDGWTDLAVTNAGIDQRTRKAIWVYHNQADGTFLEMGQAVGIRPFGDVHGIAWGDYDNDGWLDLGVAGTTTQHTVYHNRGDGVFQAMSARIGLGGGGGNDLSWVDLDNDGWLDLYVGGSTGHRAYVNRRDGTFQEMARQLGVYNPKGKDGHDSQEGAAWGDYDHDGYPDVFVAGTSPNELYRNPGNGNHWLVVQPMGVQSNRSAIGAKVWLHVGGQRHVREIDGGSGYGSHSLGGAASGVGTATGVDSVIIWWPSGQVDRWVDLAVDQAVEVVEGQASAVRVVYGTGAWQLDRLQAQPDLLPQGRTFPVLLTTRVIPPTPGRRPDQVTVDLRAIGGAKSVALQDDGRLGDLRAGDGIWCRSVRVAPTVPAGEYGLPVTVRDARGQPQGSAQRIRLTIWPPNRAIHTDSLAAGWQVTTQGTATSDMAATDHVYQGRVAHRLRLPDSKATVRYRAVDPLGVPVWGAQTVECWVWGETVEAVRGLTVSGMTLSTLGVQPAARQWLPARVPINEAVKRSQGLSDRLPELVFGRVAAGPPVEVWVDEVRIVAASLPGAGQQKLTVEVSENPLTDALLPNVPNPFNAETVLRYHVGGSRAQPVVLRVHNPAGQVVRTVVEAEHLPGTYAVRWDGRDARGREVASGMYLARLRVGPATQTQKVLLVR